MKIAVIGAGAYGSYSIAVIQQRFPEAEITLFDAGDAEIKNESEIGYKTNLFGDGYTGLKDGRFFGFGGATARWGGQLLLFSQKDFSAPSSFLRDIIRVGQTYKERVLKRFGILPDNREPSVSTALFVKTGIWLGYFSRNLFRFFRVGRRKNVKIVSRARVLKVIVGEGNKVTGLDYWHKGQICHASGFDAYFLTAGAFESTRILLSSGVLRDRKVPFSDHLSQRVFKIKGPTKIGDQDFAFRVRGTSLITKRLIGEVDGVSFFANPIYNADFSFFQNLKKVMFRRELTFSNIFALLKDFPSCCAFVWHVFVLKKIMVYKNEWDLYIDIENPDSKSFVKLASDLDQYGVSALDVEFHIGEGAVNVYREAKKLVKEYLVAHQVSFEECADDIHVEKCEDTYHPYGMLCDFKTLDDYYAFFPNMLVVNTGVLPRAGGINSTAAMFPIIEDYVARIMQ